MKAAIVDRYGPPSVVRIKEQPRPSPRDSEVLVRVIAAAVTSGDARIRAGRFPRGFTPIAKLMFGVTGPRKHILGTTFSGIVDSVGARIEGLAPGDAVCGMTGAAMGAHAEFLTVDVRRITAKPSLVSHSDAAAVLFGGTTALHYLRDKGQVKPGDTVLVNGASGAVGTSAVQLAKRLGAVVTAVTSPPNIPLVTQLGADHVIDYTTTVWSAVSDRFDIVLDTVGNLDRESGTALLSDRGVLLLAVADLWNVVRAGRRVKAGVAPERPTDFAFLVRALGGGDLVVVVEEMGGLDSLVAAYELIDSGHKVGNLVIRPDEP